MITPSGTLIEVYKNQNDGTTLKIERDPHDYYGGWLAFEDCDVEYLIEALQKYKSWLDKQ